MAALIASLPANLIGSSLSERKDFPLFKREPKPEGREILGKLKEILGNLICGSLKLKTKPGIFAGLIAVALVKALAASFLPL